MTRLPSLDSYDVQGVRPAVAALYGDDVVYALDDLDPETGEAGYGIEYDD